MSGVGKPKKSLGQHFLINPCVCSRIVALAEIGEGDQVLEIGPGRGALTKKIYERPFSRLILLEKDEDLATERAREAPVNVDVVRGDALLYPWNSLRGKWKILGNLPYNVASPLIWNIVSGAAWTKAVFMTQKEVAERLAAPPGARAYGALSVWTQSYAAVKYEFTLKPGSFSPPPKVDSAVLSFTPLAPERRPRNPVNLKILLDLCFQNRRKQLGGVFSRANLEYLNDYLNDSGIPLTSRAEELSPEIFNELAPRLNG